MKNTYPNLKETFTRRMCGYCEIGKDYHSGLLTIEVIYGEELLDHEDIKRMLNDIQGYCGITEDIPYKVIQWFKDKNVNYCKCTYEVGNVTNVKIEMHYNKN